MTSLDGWYRIPVPVRFRDLDPMGHAHHTMPLIYLEEARALFWSEIRGDSSLEAIDYVMAEVIVRFHARMRFPSTIIVGLKVTNVGTKSFGMDFELRDEADVLLSSGSTVQVMYDYAAGASKVIDQDLRGRLLGTA